MPRPTNRKNKTPYLIFCLSFWHTKRKQGMQILGFLSMIVLGLRSKSYLVSEAVVSYGDTGIHRIGRFYRVLEFYGETFFIKEVIWLLWLPIFLCIWVHKETREIMLLSWYSRLFQSRPRGFSFYDLRVFHVNSSVLVLVSLCLVYFLLWIILVIWFN